MDAAHQGTNWVVEPGEADTEHSDFALDIVQQNPAQLHIALEINILITMNQN